MDQSLVIAPIIPAIKEIISYLVLWIQRFQEIGLHYLEEFPESVTHLLHLSDWT